MSNNNRPEWAQGPEWDGWCGSPGGSHITRSDRSDGSDFTICYVDGEYDLSIGNINAVSDNPDSILYIANLIAEDRGGWA